MRLMAGCIVLSFVAACGGKDAVNGAPDDASAGDAGTGPRDECSVVRGARMARLETNVETFCIDTTEVSRREYAEYDMDRGNVGAAVPSFCDGVATGSADPSCMEDPSVCQGAACDEHPQVCINVCDAMAYCLWAGKELCGAVGGGILRNSTGEESTAGLRWRAACGGGLDRAKRPLRRFAYGDAYRDGLCNAGTSASEQVGDRAGCAVVENNEVRDLSGNVNEWVARFDEQPGGLVSSVAVGGSFTINFDDDELSCASNYGTGAFDGVDPQVGFRCCKSAP